MRDINEENSMPSSQWHVDKFNVTVGQRADFQGVKFHREPKFSYNNIKIPYW